MTENKLWIVRVLFAVLHDSDTAQRPVVFDRDRARGRVDVDLDRRDVLWVQGVAVDGVHQNFIKYLEQCG